jgi:hypothetical protein
MVLVRTWPAIVILLLASTACTSGADSEPARTSPQPSPSPEAPGPSDLAASAPQGRWRIVVSSDSAYYPGGTSTQDLMFRLVCEEECIGTLQTEGGTLRTVRWDGQRLLVQLPEEETGDALCFDGDQQPVPGSATMTVRRAHEFALESSDRDEEGRPTRLQGGYDETIGIDHQSTRCGFPETFTGRWSWSLRSLESEAAGGTA